LTSKTRISAATTRLLGGTVCLDLANTIDWTVAGNERPDHTDVLATPGDLAVWGARLGLVTTPRISVTEGELKATRELRLAIHRALAAIAAGDEAPAVATEVLMSHYAEATAAGRLEPDGDRWKITSWRDDPRQIRFAAAVDAIELMTDPARLGRVRICPGNDCGWLFIDRSGRRRWCSMETCGSRAKMRRLYARRVSGRD
jgi:predicted RNA-binding Zn ribbon-like protein